jgi:hypothetical protein
VRERVEAVERREKQVVAAMREVEERQDGLLREHEDKVGQVRRDIKAEADELTRQREALDAVRESLGAREEAVRRQEEQVRTSMQQVQQASATLGELETRRAQVRDAIAHLASLQLAQDETLAEIGRRESEVEGREARLVERERACDEQEVRVQRRLDMVEEEQDRLRQDRAAADLASQKDKDIFAEASQQITRRMQELAQQASEVEATSRALHVRDEELAATLARVHAKERALDADVAQQASASLAAPPPSYLASSPHVSSHAIRRLHASSAGDAASMRAGREQASPPHPRQALSSSHALNVQELDLFASQRARDVFASHEAPAAPSPPPHPHHHHHHQPPSPSPRASRAPPRPGDTGVRGSGLGVGGAAGASPRADLSAHRSSGGVGGATSTGQGGGGQLGHSLRGRLGAAAGAAAAQYRRASPDGEGGDCSSAHASPYVSWARDSRGSLQDMRASEGPADSLPAGRAAPSVSRQASRPSDKPFWAAVSQSTLGQSADPAGGERQESPSRTPALAASAHAARFGAGSDAEWTREAEAEGRGVGRADADFVRKHIRDELRAVEERAALVRKREEQVRAWSLIVGRRRAHLVALPLCALPPRREGDVGAGGRWRRRGSSSSTKCATTTGRSRSSSCEAARLAGAPWRAKGARTLLPPAPPCSLARIPPSPVSPS